MKKAAAPISSDRPIPYAVVDLDAPIPYRVRVATPSHELRSFVAPVLGIEGQTTRDAIPAERSSEIRIRVAAKVA
jgi:hypothetical protein